MSTYDLQFDAARRAVARASEVCRRVQQNLDSVRAITKDDRSPVTVADFASQAVVSILLSGSLGPVRLVAEENAAYLRDPAHAPHLGAAVDAVRTALPEATAEQVLAAIDVGAAEPARDGFWTLDPVDGTKGFLRAQQYAVSLAFLVDWRPVLGVLGCPNLPWDPSAPLDTGVNRGCVFGAMLGHGVRVWSEADLSSSGTDVRRRTETDPTAITVCSSVEESHSNSASLQRVLAEASPGAKSLRLDSQCKYAVVARGQADLYLRLPTSASYIERIWDHAAGELIAVEAGCVVTDVAGRALDYSRGRGLDANRGIICAPLGLHQRVVAAALAAGVA